MNAPMPGTDALEKNFEMSLLLDFYGEILSDKQREAMNLYYNEDLSLSEIASITSLTRPGVRDRIVKATEILKNLEDKLHLSARFTAIKEDADALVVKLEAVSDILSDSGIGSHALDGLNDAIADAKRIADNI